MECNAGKICLLIGLLILLCMGSAVYMEVTKPDPAMYVVLNGVKQPGKYYNCSSTGRGTGYMCYREPRYKGGAVLFNGNTLHLEWAE